ncbi:MAG: allophanate hydrolase subunit 1 [Leptolyngbyaceae cyanobacterium MO_188.B28]|nr:allophanate hydrolase subunit 1 [Leptolyngbyaceae cyanobacterium MO_188.B28]
MIYQTLRYRLAGERHLLIEQSDEVDLTVNFKAISLAQMLLGSPEMGPDGIRAIVDVVPSFSTVLIQYDPTVISIQGLIRFCEHCVQYLDSPHNLELSSRLIEIPVHYNDRWSRECFEQYCKTIKPIESNPEWVARLNGLGSIEKLIIYHSTPEWWVGAVGFLVGLPTLMPLNPNFRLHAPKYDPPRTWTPKGTIGVAGGFTTIYPIVVPDGYQMIGRTPAPIFDPQGQLPVFRDTPFLFRIGDRVKFRPIDEEEFEAIEREIVEGRYQYQISEPQTFRLNHYLNHAHAEIA